MTTSVQESLNNFQTANNTATGIKSSETTLNSAQPGLKRIKIGRTETKWRLHKVKRARKMTTSVQESRNNFQTANNTATGIKSSETTLKSAHPGLKRIKIGRTETKWRLFKVKKNTKSE
jgi:hypothetical protein